ncbi:lipoprotein [Actinocatenispora rupis]|uniref:Lipoprotein n=1 Tax=Actinocatenispora rupis TaxID=519421 RepID=A0A8J3JA59_9ACTN|nr:lipoprotein [Actinocatenispora rupis]
MTGDGPSAPYTGYVPPAGWFGTCPAGRGPGSLAAAGVTPEMMANAETIVSVGELMGLPTRAYVVAVATALEESGLRNLPYGDRDSLGLFQQRPSQGWGDPAEIMDPAASAATFYARLTAVPGWRIMPLTRAAQAVQRSAYPLAYAPLEPLATAIVDRITAVCTRQRLTSNAGAAAVVAAAASQLGVPYVFAGGDTRGPTLGTTPGVGFDCSGLALYAWAHVHVDLPHSSEAQYAMGTPVPRNRLRPGDLVFFHTEGPPGDASHVGVYLGDGRMIAAPDVGQTVTIQSIDTPYFTTRWLGARRY